MGRRKAKYRLGWRPSVRRAWSVWGWNGRLGRDVHILGNLTLREARLVRGRLEVNCPKVSGRERT